jgi:type VI secretion system protein ImpL
MALQVFKEGPATSESPFFAAFRAATKLETNMMREKPAEDVFWELIKGPLDYLWKFARMETACYLQTQWEEKVLSEIQGTTDQEAIDFLLVRDGPVWNFIEGPAKPFIGWRDRKGYYAKKAEALGGVIPFEPALFLFVNKAKAPKIPKKNYRVTIKGLPTDTNPEVKFRPHGTSLELQCAGSTESLINLHYPVSKTFNWSPETCGDVVLRIDVGDISLIKQYEGSQAFPNFLLDFPGGQHSFYPHEFPEEKDYLENLGIKYIKVNYDFSGHYQDVLELFKHRPEEVQRSIAWCWGR